MTTAEIQCYPLDYDALEKGHVIGTEQIESITGVNRNNKRFQLRVMSLKETIEREMGLRDRPVTIACKGETLCILTDEEAAHYNAAHFTQYLRRAAKSHRRNLAVDITKLNEETLVEHERRLIIDSKGLHAIRATRRRARIELMPHERSTPALGVSSPDENGNGMDGNGIERKVDEGI